MYQDSSKPSPSSYIVCPREYSQNVTYKIITRYKMFSININLGLKTGGRVVNNHCWIETSDEKVCFQRMNS